MNAFESSSRASAREFSRDANDLDRVPRRGRRRAPAVASRPLVGAVVPRESS